MTDLAQVVSEVVRARHSTRAYLEEPVPLATIEAVLELSQWAPSNCNTQPWLVHVASGQSCEALRTRLPKDLMAGNSSMGFP